MGKGSTKNEKKANSKRVTVNKKRAVEARAARQNLLQLPYNRRPANYADLLATQEGILNQALSKMKRSETHALTGK